MRAARCQQGRTCCSRSLISVIKNSRNTRPHPVRECKRVGVSAQISGESCYTDASLVLGYLMRSIFSLSWLTWGETSQVADSAQLLGAQGTGFFSLHRSGTQSALGIFKLVGQQQVSTSQSDTQRVDSQRPNCSNGVRICVFSLKYFLFLKIW